MEERPTKSQHDVPIGPLRGRENQEEESLSKRRQ